MANIRDVAKATNYSISTISKAFSNSTDISEETRKIIISTAKKMGYEFKNTKKRSKGDILVLTKGIKSTDKNDFGYELVFSFTAAAYNAGYNVIVESESDETVDVSYEEIIEKGGYIGGFVIGYTQDEIVKKNIHKCQVPTVALDNLINNPYVACVGSDNERGMALAVEHLSKLGHKKIAMISGERESFVAKVRKRAFTLVMANLNLPCHPEMHSYSNFLKNYVAEHVETFLNQGATAIICASDLIANNVIEYLKSKNIDVPKDISVIGYDNAPIASKTNPQLTTIDQNVSDIGSTALYVLLQLIGGVNISKLLLRPKLIQRDSTGPVHHR